MQVTYANTSPYYNTPQNSSYLEIWTPRPIVSQPDDTSYVIASAYDLKPELLSYDLYGTTRLWWVFALRNPDVIQDPIYDFTAGTTIWLTSAADVRSQLGI